MSKINEANLPSATAGAMVDCINQAEQDSDELHELRAMKERLLDQIEEHVEQNNELRQKLDDANSKLATQEELEAARQAVSDRERAVELEITEVKLKAADERVAMVEHLVEKVFGHLAVTVSNTKTVPLVMQGEGTSPYQTGTTSEVEDTKTTHSKE